MGLLATPVHISTGAVGLEGGQWLTSRAAATGAGIMWSASWQLSDLRQAIGALARTEGCALTHTLHRSLSGAQRSSRSRRKRAACGKAWGAAWGVRPIDLFQGHVA